jgi:hypothetical protein
MNPDGLNRVAMDLGFIHAAQSGSGPLSGYSIPALLDSSFGRLVAGTLGAAVVLTLMFVIGWALQKRSDPESTVAKHSSQF